MGITFKKLPRDTRVGYPHSNVEIKWNKKVVGLIAAPTWQTKDNLWSIRFTVKKTPSDEDPSSWKWIFLKAKLTSEEEAREFVKDNITKLMENYDLCCVEDEED